MDLFDYWIDDGICEGCKYLNPELKNSKIMKEKKNKLANTKDDLIKQKGVKK